ncbi:MAG: InlB B-repeat-containing protein [Prevotella sp.]|nr:InlB B-repeat-containing protein [Prevotella sp.]
MKRLLTSAALFLCSLLTFAQFSGSGSGTESDPYLIFNPIQLNQLRNFLNQSGVYFKLMADIDLTEFIEDENPDQGWQPVGNSSSAAFKGILDGNGKTIKGLWIKRSSTNYVGFFGYTDGATISNVNIEVSTIEGKESVGGVSGYSQGSTISNCSFRGSVKGGNCVGGYVGNSGNNMTLSADTAIVDITGTGNSIGGFVGRNDAGNNLTISGCVLNNGIIRGINNVGGCCGENKGNHYNSNDISNTYIHANIFGEDYVGGICGFSQISEHTINLDNCGFAGEIVGSSSVGGLVGKIDNTKNNRYAFIQKCFAVGSISASGDYLGGLIGNDSGYVWSYTNLVDCYHSGPVTGANYVGGLVGYKKYGETSNCYSIGSVAGNRYIGGLLGYQEGSTTLKKSVAINTRVTATTGDVNRVVGSNKGNIGAMGSTDENKAYNRTIVINQGVAQDIADDLLNGTGVSSTTLKLKATYVAMGWDFTDTWDIQETECYPYFKTQTAPPVITSQVISGATTVSGKCVDGGTITLEIDGVKQQMVSTGNTFSFTVSPLQAGHEVRVSAKADGKEQSYYTTEVVSFLGKGTEADPYQISTAADLTEVYRKGYYKLMNDIDLTSYINQYCGNEGWESIGRDGSETIYFDGNNHKVTGLWCNSTRDNTGLFSCFANGYIKNLTVEVADGKKVKGGANTGILIGKLINGTIVNCRVSGSLADGTPVGGIVGMLDGGKITLCQAELTVSTTGANAYVGGIAGESSGDIDQCVTLGSVNATGNSTNAAGIVGKNSGNVTNSYSSMKITSVYCAAGVVGYNYGTVDKCYAYGDLKSMNYAAGVVGYNDGTNAKVSNCAAMNNKLDVTYESQSGQSGGYGQRILGGMKNNAPSPEMNNYALNTMQVTVNDVPQKVYDDLMNGVAKTQAELTTASPYQTLGWNFSSVWSIETGNGYPYLKAIGIVTEAPATMYNLIYMVDGEEYKTVQLSEGDAITPEANPTKDGYTFAGWSEIPTTMPAHDVTITGTFTEIIDPNDTDVSQYDNVVFFENAEAFVGKSLTLSLKMNNTMEITGVQCDIYLPEGMTFAKDEDGYYMAELSTERTTASKTNIFDAVLQSDGALRILASSTKSAAFSGNSGEVATIVINVSKDMADGDYPIVIKSIELADKSGSNYSVSRVKSTVTVASYKLGDVNADGKVNVADITVIANNILNLPNNTFVEAAADLNGDGKVNVADITCLANLILYGNITGEAAGAKAMFATIPSITVSIPAMNIQRGHNVQLPVNISNKNADFSAFQFDVALPAGVEIVDASFCASRKASEQMIFNYAKQESGTYRIMGANLDGSVFAGDAGNIVLLTLAANEAAESGAVEVSEIVLAENGNSYTASKATGLLTVNEPTGIDRILWNDGTVTVCTINGVVIKANATEADIDQLPQGIYIINGQKISKP